MEKTVYKNRRTFHIVAMPLDHGYKVDVYEILKDQSYYLFGSTLAVDIDHAFEVMTKNV